MNKNYQKIINNLDTANTEEDVKNVFARHFKIKYDTSGHHDLYTPQILFEFKFNKNFNNIKTKATIFAQILYYAHRLKFGFTQKPIPKYLCLTDKNFGIITETYKWSKYYSNLQKYDWDLAPSMPDKTLIENLINDSDFNNLHIYNLQNEHDYNILFEKLSICLDSEQSLDLIDKKVITEENFEDVFEYWNGIFGASVKNGFKTSKYFVCDIQKGKTHLFENEGKVFFDFGSGEGRTKKILLKDYQFFWKLYQKVESPDIMRGILSKMDRLTQEDLRRFHGEFFTPLRFANKALEYIEKTVGKKWWESGEYRLWDMAAGTGNLEYHLPHDAYQYMYLSTLWQTETDHCQKLFSNATVFQYDYLNDDVANVFADGGLDFNYTWKLPKKLRDDLSNPKLKWIILINPPFATAQTAGANSQSKQDVSDTMVRKIMHEQKLGEVSRELFSQFIFRIKKEFENKKTHFGLFSKIKYLNANNDQKLRDLIFKFEHETGFMFSSSTFSGTSDDSSFPVSFMLWVLNRELHLKKQQIKIDIFNDEVEKIGIKHIPTVDRKLFLSKWVKRPPAKNIFPPVSSSINLNFTNKDRRDRISENFLASFMCAGNDFQSQNQTALASAPFVSAGALSVTADNFEKSMVVHAVRRIPKATWINDRDQFLQPNKNLSQEFINDCIVWSLFSNSNETTAIKDVEYENKTYQIKNNFFPFLISELKKWQITDSDFSDMLSADEDRYVACWLQKAKLQDEANEVLKAGKEFYKFYFKNLHQLRTDMFEIKTYDTGFWQIKKVLKDQNMADDLLKTLKEKHNTLKQKILPQIYDYGFISKLKSF